MDRRCFLRSARFLLPALAAATLLWASGCNMFLMATYLIKGTNLPAEYTKLKDKRVVVVCRPVVSLHYANARVEQDLAQQIGGLLRKNVSKIKVVDQRKAAEWMDQNQWEDYVEVGKALQADVVLGVDLEQFSILQGQTLYQGRAVTHIKVYDCKTGELLFSKRPPPSVYPPNRPVPTSEKQESEFRREFIRVLADQIGRHFYEHDAYEDFALDAKSME